MQRSLWLWPSAWRRRPQKCSPKPGSHPSRLEPGEREYRGYCEWAVHPLEAQLILTRGYAIVDGQRCHVDHIHDEAFCVQVRVWGSDPAYTTLNHVLPETDSLKEEAA